VTEVWPLSWSVLAFAGSAGVLIPAGVRLTRLVDRLADRTGLGEALAGAVLLGATTSLPGLVTTTVAAADGQAELAVSNAVGGIAAQTTWLALADLRYRHANLEHAAASLPNLLQTTVLVALLALALGASSAPRLALGGVHLVTFLMPLVYGYGLVLARRTRTSPMWEPRLTSLTRPDVPDERIDREPLWRLWMAFAVLALVVAATGWVVAGAGRSLAVHTGLSSTFVGGFLTSVVTSLPELVTVLAAVRAGALTLAVGDIIGGNSFDVLFLAAADLAYADGTIYAAIGPATTFLMALTVFLTGLLTAGLIYRQETGIGFEGVAMLAFYAAGFAALLAGLA